MSTSPQHNDLVEPFRSYLKVLADLQIGQRLRRKVDASDIVQRTMLKAHRSLGELRDHRPEVVIAWLREILTHELADTFRYYQRDRRDIGLECGLKEGVDRSACQLESWLAADHTSPSDAAARNEETLRLADALLQLPDDQREVVVLKHLQGLPLGEIATKTGRTTASVAGLLRRGLARLRTILTEPVDHEL